MDGVTGAVRFVPTGWPSLDGGLNGGLLPKTLTAIAAKPGTGTSALVMNLCLNAAAAGHCCLLLTHDARELCLAKMLAATAGVHIGATLHQLGSMMSEEVADAACVLSKLAVVVKDIPSDSHKLKDAIEDFASDCNYVRNEPLLIVVDGLDDFHASSDDLNSLKSYASLFKAAVVVTAHEEESRFSDVMCCCDSVLSLEEDKEKLDVMALHVRKCRYSTVFQNPVQMVLLPAGARFFEVADEQKGDKR